MPIPEPGCCDTQYQLIRKILEALPFISGGGGSGNVQSGSQAIGNGVNTISVVFPVAFTTTPDVVVTMSRPVGNPLLDVNIDEASITTTGFTASINAAAPNANYNLKWIANE